VERRRAVGLIAVIGAPSSMGAHSPGQEQAPAALRAAGLAERLGSDLLDLGDTTLRRWAPDREHRRAQNAAAVAAAADEVAELVGRALRAGARALVLGGDCTVELGVVAGARSAGLRPGLVYFDMHPDLNTPETIVGGTFDWMGVAHMLALPGTHPEVSGPRAPLIAPADLVLLAADAAEMTAGERRAIADHDLATIPLAEVAADPQAAAARALATLDHDHLLVHFDVDVVDFVDQPLSENTGLNIGLPFATARVVLETVLADPRVATLTVTEHNPFHGAADGSTTGALADALAAALSE
jgi:arginase